MKAQHHPEYHPEWTNLEHTLEALAARIESLAQANLMTAYDNAAEALLMQYRAEYRALKSVLDSPYFARVDFAPHDPSTTLPTPSGRGLRRAGAGRTLTCYVGKKGFEHGDDAVIDWRAPLAALFYRGKPGEASYTSPAGAVRGRLQLKRNLDIQARELVTIADDFDVREMGQGVAEPGEFLRQKLDARRDPFLQEIIATIQAQQYDLIQADASQVLVTQGVAGSGKTSVALHRLAYLLHPGNADGIEARRCIVFGPNRLFLSYIASVLPELDIGQVTQTTFAEWACEQLGLDPRTVDDVALEAILSPAAGARERDAEYRRSVLRNSHNMGRLLERYVELRRRVAIPENGLTYTGIGPLTLTVRLPPEQIVEAHARFAELPLNRHRERFVETLKARLTRAYDETIARRLDETPETSKQFAAQAARLREEAAQLQRLAILTRSLDDVALKERNTAQSLDRGAAGLLELATYYERQADAAVMQIQRTRDEVYEANVWRQAVEQLAAQLATDVDRYWPPLSAVTEYYALLADGNLLSELGRDLFSPDEIAVLRRARPEAGDRIDLNDLPALHFLHILVEGVEPRYDHIVVDEAQDVSRLQLEAVRRFSRNGSLTILGDLPQSIHAHRGIARWDEVRQAFDGWRYSFHEINVSYRATREITTFANTVLQSLAASTRGISLAPDRVFRGLAQPFERRGEAPQLHHLRDESELPQAIAGSVTHIRSQGYENIAIITKTVDAGIALAVALYDHLDAFEMIESAEVEYRGGLVLLPVHLAKGMEFEAALVVGVDETTYDAAEFDARLLYVAVTRALHVLHVFWIGNISKHLEAAVLRSRDATDLDHLTI
ncbi:MAG TPA: UvrD-helicase domain-containing protein [Anaerolineae bacterium]|nr:UvrD-helicase domain-containing protein [Anaerolineae bacterium]